MEYRSLPYERPTPFSVRVCQTLAVILFVGVLIPWAGVIRELRKPRVILNTEQIACAANEDLARYRHAQAKGNEYLATDFMIDSGEYLKLANALRTFDGNGLDRVEKSIEAHRMKLYELAHANLELEYRNARRVDMYGSQSAKFYADQAMSSTMVGTRDIMFDQASYPFLPKVSEKIPWPSVTHRWLLASLFSMIPALIGIGFRLRSRGRSLAWEVLVRPYAVTLATVFWGWGLYHFDGCVSRDDGALVWRRIQTVPAAVQHRSRWAMMTGTLVAVLAGPVQTLFGVGMVLAQTVKASAGAVVAAVDSTQQRRRSATNGLAFFQTQWTPHGGITQPNARAKICQQIDAVTATAEVNLITGKPRVLSVSTQVLPGATATFGQDFCPTGYDYDNPRTALFCSSPLDNTLLTFIDQGVFADVTIGHAEMQAALLNGEGANATAGDKRFDVSGRLTQSVGPATVSVAAKHTAEHLEYRSLFVNTTKGNVTAQIGHAQRTGPNLSAEHLRCVYRHEQWRGGIQSEWWRDHGTMSHRGLSVAVERSLGGFQNLNRIVAFVTAREGTRPTCGLMVQGAFGLPAP